MVFRLWGTRLIIHSHTLFFFLQLFFNFNTPKYPHHAPTHIHSHRHLRTVVTLVIHFVSIVIVPPPPPNATTTSLLLCYHHLNTPLLCHQYSSPNHYHHYASTITSPSHYVASTTIVLLPSHTTKTKRG